MTASVSGLGATQAAATAPKAAGAATQQPTKSTTSQQIA